MSEIVERLRESTVQVVFGHGGGAGVAWNDQGMVVTNAHVLRGRAGRVRGADGREAPARIVNCDRERDLALLATDLPLHPLPVADSRAVKPGQIVFAVGSPLGRAGAVTMGMIHGTGPLGLGPRRDWIQADVHLAPGNSGGLLSNAEGEVIGINTMIFNGLGLAIPSNEVREFASGGTGGIRLGVEMAPTAAGLVVIAIERGSVAERAEVFIGDVLRCTADELRLLLSQAKRSGSCEIPVLRGGREKTLRVHIVQEARAA